MPTAMARALRCPRSCVPLLLPAGGLRRYRCLFLIASFVASVPMLSVFVFVTHAPLSVRALGVATLAGLCCAWVYRYRRRAPWWLDVVETGGLVVLATSAGNPDMALGVFYTSAMYRALTGPGGRRLASAISYVGAYAAATRLIGPIAGTVTVDVVFQAVGLASTIALMHLVAITVERHDRALSLERILVEASVALAADYDRAAIGEIASRAAEQLLSTIPGAVARLAFPGSTTANELLDLDALRHMRSTDSAAGAEVRLTDVAAAAAVRQITGTGPAQVVWLFPLQGADTHRGVFVLLSPKVVPTDLRRAFASLGAACALAAHGAQLTDSLRRSEVRFRSLVQSVSDLILLLDGDGTIEYVGPAVTPMLGYREAELVGRSIAGWLSPAGRSQLERLLASGRDPGVGAAVTVEVIHADGTWRQLDVVANYLCDDPSVRGVVITARDVTERMVLEQQLAHQAFHDALTGLPNRMLFFDRLTQATTRVQPQPGDQLAVLFLDLDNFKVVNDSLGHQVGDALLVAVADRLRSCVRPETTVARLGGDEFTVLLDGLTAPEVERVAERIAQALSAPFSLQGRSVVTTCSIGMAVREVATQSADELLRDADAAMYEAKRRGKARIAAFDPRLASRARERLDLEQDLRRAIAVDEFELHYQPIVDLASGTIQEVEALVRWRHPQRGLLPPAAFIPLAEETGLIVALGELVVAKACGEAAPWQRLEPELLLSVNLSAQQLQQPQLVERLMAIQQEAGLAAGALKLEITESAVIQELDAAVATMHALRAAGMRLALDDFGTGYSALTYLKRFPVDTLKIDRSFVAGLGKNDEDEAIVRAVIAVAQALGLTATAEGIETAAQRAALDELGCDQGQGYLFSRPVPASVMHTLLGSVPLHWAGRPDTEVA